MLAIRFARVGKTKQPTYRIAVSEKGRDTFGKSLEILGHFNPRSKVCAVNAERIRYWISVGAKPSPTVHNLLVDQHVIEEKKVRSWRPKRKKVEAQATANAPAPAAAGKPGEAEVPEEKEVKEKAASAEAKA